MSKRIVTPRMLAANRANAKKSTGPRTREGKLRSRYNGVTHGLSISGEFLPPDEVEGFRANLREYWDSLRPASAVESSLTLRLCLARWRAERALQAEDNVLAAVWAQHEAKFPAARQDASDLVYPGVTSLHITRESRILSTLMSYYMRHVTLARKTWEELNSVQRARLAAQTTPMAVAAPQPGPAQDRSQPMETSAVSDAIGPELKSEPVPESGHPAERALAATAGSFELIETTPVTEAITLECKTEPVSGFGHPLPPQSRTPPAPHQAAKVRTVPPDTAAVRAGEELDASSLSSYLREKLPGFKTSLEIEQFPGGHSNLTYLLRVPGSEFVLRRAPLGPVAPKAHDMAREYAVLAAVAPHFPEAPRVYHLCEDPSIVGAPFFLMERRRGVILRNSVPPAIAAQPDYAAKLSEAFIACQARLHSIDIQAAGLISLGKPSGFVERQVRGWADRWRRAQTDEIPLMDNVIDWLERRLPRPSPAALVHNDFKLDNVMFSETGSRIEAVLDWEMTAVGDPLVDVGLTLCYWSWANAPDFRAAGVPAITGQPGWHSRERFIERYADATGRDMTDIGYYEVLGAFKLAVIVQQIYYRYWKGQTQDPRFRDLGERAKGLICLAANMAEQFA